MPSYWHANGTKGSSQLAAKFAVNLQSHSKYYHQGKARNPTQWQKGQEPLLIIELKGVLYHVASAVHASFKNDRPNGLGQCSQDGSLKRNKCSLP